MNKKKFYENPEVTLIEMFDTDILANSDNIGKDSGENDGEWA